MDEDITLDEYEVDGVRHLRATCVCGWSTVEVVDQDDEGLRNLSIEGHRAHHRAMTAAAETASAVPEDETAATRIPELKSGEPNG